MFNKEYKYHVSYNWNKKNNNGMGSLTFITSDKLNTTERIQVLKNIVEKENDFDNVVIMNIIKLR